MVKAPVAFAQEMFLESEVQNLLEVTKACSSLKSQQAMLDVASRSQARYQSPRRSPGHPVNKRRNSCSPNRSPKRVRFDALPHSSAKSPPPPKKNFQK